MKKLKSNSMSIEKLFPFFFECVAVNFTISLLLLSLLFLTVSAFEKK
jgi:hypothetical protein